MFLLRHNVLKARVANGMVAEDFAVVNYAKRSKRAGRLLSSLCGC
jgi:hypothetical protein